MPLIAGFGMLIHTKSRRTAYFIYGEYLDARELRKVASALLCIVYYLQY